MMVLLMLVDQYTSKLSVWKTCWELMMDQTLTKLLRSVITSTEMITSTRFGNQIYFDDYVKFCCEDIGVAGLQVKLRVFDRDPGAGPVNPNRMRCRWRPLSVTTTIAGLRLSVEDKLAPFISCPDDITVSCEFWFDMNDLNSTFGTVRDDDANDVEYIVINDRVCPGDPLYDPNDPERNLPNDSRSGRCCW